MDPHTDVAPPTSRSPAEAGTPVAMGGGSGAEVGRARSGPAAGKSEPGRPRAPAPRSRVLRPAGGDQARSGQAAGRARPGAGTRPGGEGRGWAGGAARRFRRLRLRLRRRLQGNLHISPKNHPEPEQPVFKQREAHGCFLKSGAGNGHVEQAMPEAASAASGS